MWLCDRTEVEVGHSNTVSQLETSPGKSSHISVWHTVGAHNNNMSPGMLINRWMLHLIGCSIKHEEGSQRDGTIISKKLIKLCWLIQLLMTSSVLRASDIQYGVGINADARLFMCVYVYKVCILYSDFVVFWHSLLAHNQLTYFKTLILN